MNNINSKYSEHICCNKIYYQTRVKFYLSNAFLVPVLNKHCSSCLVVKALN